MRRLLLLVWCGALACVPTPLDVLDAGFADDSDAGPDDSDAGIDDDDLPCAAAGTGLALEETGAFTAGGQGDGVVVLMGGGAEVDRASARFVDGAQGGDVLVLRATGSTSSYTGYFAEDLAPLLTRAPAAVATVRIDDPARGADAAVLCRLQRADAVWLAGGDQSDYLVHWPVALQDALQQAIARGVAVGGTSAGAMALSAFSFDARLGSISSDEALQDPTAAIVSVTPSAFPAVPGVVVDTHFQARDREGRLLVFMARAGDGVRGVGLDEGTALILDGAAAAVQADDGGSAWVYAAAGVHLDDGAPLSIDAVQRVSFSDGAAMEWPPSLADADPLVVDHGVVR